jgi:DNA-binding GntR family transcriptional regulator
LERALERYLDTGGEIEFDTSERSANEAFHGVILRAAANERLTATVSELARFVPREHAWRAAAEAGALERLDRDDHEAILAALAERRAPAARRAMTAHISRAGELLIAHLDRHRFWD